jgi:hypothetical protein
MFSNGDKESLQAGLEKGERENIIMIKKEGGKFFGMSAKRDKDRKIIFMEFTPRVVAQKNK